MNTVPIINVSNAASAGATAPKATSGSSDQSFGQALNNASAAANGTSETSGNGGSSGSNSTSSASASGSASSSTTTSSSGTSGTTSTSSANGTSGSNGTSGTSGTSTGKSKSNNSTAQSTDTSGSTQILALMTNVQQSDSNGGGNGNSSSNSDDNSTSITALAASSSASAVSALNDDSNSAASAGQPVDPNTAAQAAGTDAAALKSAMNLKQLPIPASSPLPALAGKDAANIKELALDRSGGGTDGTNTDSLQQPVSDLAAATDKDAQAGLAALDADVAAASLKAAQTAPTIDATAIPQQVALSAQTVQSDPGEKLTPQVGSPGWDQALGQKVVWMVAGGQQSASLTLNPPDLGPMQVVLNVNNSHATATFTAAQPEVRQALEAAMPKLREMLGDAGIQLGQTSVNSGSAQQQASSEQNGQSANRGGTTTDAVDVPIAMTSARTVSSGLGLVDTFA